MRVLVGCEESGVVREAFRRRGHDAWSCDLLPARDGSEHHIQGDVALAMQRGWDIIILFWECTAMAVSGNAHYGKGTPGYNKRLAALDLAESLWNDAKKHSAVGCAFENPVSVLWNRIGKPEYYQPYQFGHDASKKTGILTDGLPPLRRPPRHLWHPPRMVNGKPRWGNQTDSGQNKLPPSPTRARDRAETYSGIADAMADWGNL